MRCVFSEIKFISPNAGHTFNRICNLTDRMDCNGLKKQKRKCPFWCKKATGR